MVRLADAGSRTSALREEKLGGGNDLAGVPLSVVGNMDDQSGKSGGQTLFANETRLFKGCWVEAANAGSTLIQRGPKFTEKLRDSFRRIVLGRQRGQLVRTEFAALGVGEQAIQTKGNVTEMEADGRQSRGAGVYFLRAKAGAPTRKIFASELECVQGSALDGGDVGEGCTQPRFGLGVSSGTLRGH
jgi:hypothetical protein